MPPGKTKSIIGLFRSDLSAWNVEKNRDILIDCSDKLNRTPVPFERIVGPVQAGNTHPVRYQPLQYVSVTAARADRAYYFRLIHKLYSLISVTGTGTVSLIAFSAGGRLPA